MSIMKSLVVVLVGLFGLSASAAPQDGVDVLKNKMTVKGKSFEEAKQSTQDWTTHR